jgi:hypothetical protein
MHALSSCCSQFGQKANEKIKEHFGISKESSKDEILNVLNEDRFLFSDDRKVRFYSNVLSLIYILSIQNSHDFFGSEAVMDMTVELFFTGNTNLGGIFLDKLLQEDDLEERWCLLTVAAKLNLQPVPSSFDYVDMSSDALHGPLVATMAFAGIVVSLFYS